MSLTFPCVYCTDDLKCTKYTDDEATSFCVLGPCKDEKPSHGDRIRAMTDEEMAEWLDNNTYRFPIYKDWLEWLKKEADNG